MANQICKVAFISGANRGLGFETARELGEAGVHVVIGARDQTSGDKAAAELRSKGFQVDAFKIDVTSPADQRALYEFLDRTYGRLDILVNNAGVILEDNVPNAGPHNTVLQVSTAFIRCLTERRGDDMQSCSTNGQRPFSCTSYKRPSSGSLYRDDRRAPCERDGYCGS